MPPYTSGRLNSEIIKVLAESGERVFNVHSNILTAQSKPLTEAVKRTSVQSGGLKEIHLNQWDGDTVERVLDFLYSGGYDVPRPEPLQPTGTSVASEVGEEIPEHTIYTPDTGRSESSLSDRSDSTIHESTTMSRIDRPLTPLSRFRDPIHNTGHECDGVEECLDNFPPTNYDYESVLLAHAKVYALAQHEEIMALQRLSLQRLLTVLTSLESSITCSHIAANIFRLLECVYMDTESPISECGDEPMRRLVSQFVAIGFPALGEASGMREVLKKGGDLVPDLLGKLLRRLVNSESQLKILQAVRLTSKADAYPIHSETQEPDTTALQSAAVLRRERQARRQAEECLSLLRNHLQSQSSVTLEQLQNIEGDLYQHVQVLTPKQFQAHQGYGLAYWDDREQPEAARPKVYRILKFTEAHELLTMVATDLDIDASRVRLWTVGKRRYAIRIYYVLSFLDMSQPVSYFQKYMTSSRVNNECCKLQFWAEVTDVNSVCRPLWWDKPTDNYSITIHLKYFDVQAQTLCGVGYEYVKRKEMIETLIPKIISRMGWADDTRLLLYEELGPGTIIPIKPSQTFIKALIIKGDIISFQKSYNTSEMNNFESDNYIVDIIEFYEKLERSGHP